MIDTTLHYTHDYALLIGICIMGTIMHKNLAIGYGYRYGYIHTLYGYKWWIRQCIDIHIKTIIIKYIHDYVL
jgi:hypothetical protein